MAVEGIRLMDERRTRGRELYMTALELDNGAYSAEAVEMLREAMRLESRPEYEGLYKKISGHARVLKVPEDYPTIGEALATARDKDKVVVGEGTYQEMLVLRAAVEVEGAGPEKTVIEYPANDVNGTDTGATHGPEFLKDLVRNGMRHLYAGVPGYPLESSAFREFVESGKRIIYMGYPTPEKAEVMGLDYRALHDAWWTALDIDSPPSVEV